MVLKGHTPSDDFQSWVSRQRGGRTQYAQWCVYATFSTNSEVSPKLYQVQKVDYVQFSLVCAPHVLGETVSGSRRRGRHLAGVLYVRCVSLSGTGNLATLVCRLRPAFSLTMPHPQSPRWLGRWSACLSRSFSRVQVPPSACS